MRFDALTEGATIALWTIRENKLRSLLTILGVVIGVATVMAMASIVQGIRQQIVTTLEVVGPTTFRIIRFFSQTPLNPDQLPREVRIRPVLQAREAEALARLPEIQYSAIWMQVFERVEFGPVQTQLVSVFGADERFMEILGGELTAGRLFTTAEARSGAPVTVLERRAADRVLGRANPIGQTVRVGGRPMRVVGLYAKPENIFEAPGTPEIAAVTPFETARRSFRYDETNALIILAKPRPEVPLSKAMDAATIQLRRMRGLRPADANTFDMITSEQILGIFDRLTGAFFLVMIVLSSVALMVGGIGVMAIMMVSVTSRTREIGVRKALGATRQDVLWQFLVEAATLTGIGGVLGILLGLGLGQALKSILGFQSGVPVWSAVVATGVSVGIGLAFGLLPANRAAKFDPVEALRYE
ncbi:MAG TPA: ABC transporter permease [Gemmatimonadales bacterium]|nr:ABC transporter permease [Gemmatimonadales bacterium]